MIEVNLMERCWISKLSILCRAEYFDILEDKVASHWISQTREYLLHFLWLMLKHSSYQLSCAITALILVDSMRMLVRL